METYNENEFHPFLVTLTVPTGQCKISCASRFLSVSAVQEHKMGRHYSDWDHNQTYLPLNSHMEVIIQK